MRWRETVPLLRRSLHPRPVNHGDGHCLLLVEARCQEERQGRRGCRFPVETGVQKARGRLLAGRHQTDSEVQRSGCAASDGAIPELGFLCLAFPFAATRQTMSTCSAEFGEGFGLIGSHGRFLFESLGLGE